MARKAKVIWTEHEEDKLYSAYLQVFKSDPRASATKASNLAQLVLPENRRRNVNSAVHIPIRLRTRLIAAGVLKHLLEQAPQEVDKNVLRIQQLGDERDEALRKAAELETLLVAQREEINQMRKQISAIPSEAQVVKTFVADILWDVESRKRALPGPTSSEIQKVVDQALPERRTALREPQPEERSKPPQVLIVGARHQFFIDYEKALNGKANVRFWTDGHIDQLMARAKAAEFIVVNNANVGHHATDAIKRAGAWDKAQLTTHSAVQAHIDLVTSWLERRAREGAKHAA